MRPRLVVLPVVAIAAGIVVFGAAASSPANVASRAGQHPVQSGVLQPLPAVRAPDYLASPFHLPSAKVARPASVDAATYAREKQAALTAPAPMGARVVDVPESPAGPRVSVVPNFPGLNRATAQNHGFIFVPPDTTLAKSPNRVLEGTNSAVRLFTPGGAVIATADLNTFFGALTTNGLLFDPKVIFDRLSNNPRFWIVALQKKGNLDADPTNDFSRIFIAVARSVDPVSFAPASWCRYSINGIRDATTANKSWADFPQVGVGSDAFLLATNQFRFPNNAFTFAILRAFRKLVAENNAASCPSIPFFTFQPAGGVAGNFDIFALQPVHANTAPSSFTGTTNPAYALSTLRGSSNRYHVWRVRNVSSSPTLGHALLINHAYAIPPPSPQPGTLVRLDTGDNRVLGASGIGNTFEGIFTSLCNFTGGTPNESCTLAPRLVVGQTSTGLVSAAIVENPFRGFGDNIFAHHPSIALNFSIKAGSSWLRSGATFRLNSVALIKNPFAGWAGVAQYAPGFCSYTTTSRTGDYSGAQTDPSNLNTFWLAGEQATNVPNLAGCNWATRIIQLIP